MPTRSRRVLHWALLLFVLWLYGGDLALWIRAQGSPVSVLSWLPSLVLALVGITVAIVYAVSLVRPVSMRVRQLSFTAVLSLLFIDFTFIASRRAGIPAEATLLQAVHELAEQASANSSPQGVIRDARALRELLPQELPPIYVSGTRLTAWQVEVREGCIGPADQRGQTPAGTLIYCVSNDRQRAWVTGVATLDAQRFGEPNVISLRPEWIGQVLFEPDEPNDDAPPVWRGPTPSGPP